MAGWLKRLHKDKAKPVFIVISGSHDTNKLVEEASQLGIYTCLTKPVNKKQLLEAVAGALK